MNTNKNLQAITDMNRIQNNISYFCKIASISFTESSELYNSTAYQDFTKDEDSQLSSYSEESRGNHLFLSIFFSIKREPKQYPYINTEILNDPYFLIYILKNKQNPDLLLLFNESLLDDSYEQLVFQIFKTQDIATLKYCPNEHYLNSPNNTESEIENFLLDMVFKHNDNYNYLPEKYKKNDFFFKKIINSAQDKNPNNSVYKHVVKNLPTNIFEHRTSEWWNENPYLFKQIVNFKMTKEPYKLKNVKNNPFYFYQLFNNDITILRKQKNLTEDTVVRILAAKHYTEQHTKPLTEDLFLSDELINYFKESLNYFSFKKNNGDKSKNENCTTWNEFFYKKENNKDNVIYPSLDFTIILKKILNVLNEEQYKEISIFKNNSLGNPLLTLNLSWYNKPQSFMLKDCLIAAHQTLYIDNNHTIYHDTIQKLFQQNFKFVKDTLNLSLDKGSINLYNLHELNKYIIPLIEDIYLDYIAPKNHNNIIAKNKIKF